MPTSTVSLSRSPLSAVVLDYQQYYQRILDLSLQHSNTCHTYVYGQIPIINGHVFNTILTPTSPLPTQYAPHPHQYNVSIVQKNAAFNILTAACPNAPVFADFEQLFNWICSILVGKNPRFPFKSVNLTIYDIALRYGFNQTPKVLPQKYVYILASGPRNGYGIYCRLYNGGKKPNKKKGYLVPTSFFSNMFAHFSPNLPYPVSMYIEDILCLYK